VSVWWRVVQPACFVRPDTAPAQQRKAHAFREDQILATILGHLESWSAYQAGSQHVPTSLDITRVLRRVADRSDRFHAERHSDVYQEVLKKRRCDLLGHPVVVDERASSY